jgi:hypothetical protein
MVEMVKPLVLLLVTVTGNVSDWPTKTSPKRKSVGLKANWVAATAGIENPAVMRKAVSNRKNAYLCTLWGRVISFSVCRRVSDQ